ncbi:MAG: transcriptional regulator [Ignavibacteriales bacterium]|nr:transcriptional regulator [Ignavibacteriales bacterium]
MKFLQKDVARVIGVDETTVYNWERGYTSPTLRYVPRILDFLGYDPAPAEPRTLGEKLLKYRKDRGITQKELARRIGIDPTTLSRLERTSSKRVFRSVLLKVEDSLRKCFCAILEIILFAHRAPLWEARNIKSEIRNKNR